MNATKTYRTTLNGANWMIEEDRFGATLFLKHYDKDGYYFSGNIFKSVAEANAYLDKIDERVSKPVEFKPIAVPADYYGVAGRYYGD